jgi:hypothetical protein
MRKRDRRKRQRAGDLRPDRPGSGVGLGILVTGGTQTAGPAAQNCGNPSRAVPENRQEQAGANARILYPPPQARDSRSGSGRACAPIPARSPWGGAICGLAAARSRLLGALCASRPRRRPRRRPRGPGMAVSDPRRSLGRRELLVRPPVPGAALPREASGTWPRRPCVRSPIGADCRAVTQGTGGPGDLGAGRFGTWAPGGRRDSG